MVRVQSTPEDKGRKISGACRITIAQKAAAWLHILSSIAVFPSLRESTRPRYCTFSKVLRSGCLDGSNLNMPTNHCSLTHYPIEQAGVGQNILAVTTKRTVRSIVGR